MTPTGNLDGRTVLATPRPAADVAKELGWDAARLAPALSAARTGMYAARAKRPAPLRDDKAVAAWNALAITAFARAAIVLGDPRYSEAALKCATTLTRTLRTGGPLAHIWMAGKESGRAFLDDHTALALALLDVFEMTSDPAWLTDATTLMDRVETKFADRSSGGYFLTADDAEPLLVRDKPGDDGPTPSGNSLAALAWERLSVLTENASHAPRAETTFRAFAAPLVSRPGALDAMLTALDFATDAPKQIAIVLPDGSERGAQSAAARPFLDVLKKTFVPNAVLAVAPASDFAGVLGTALPWAKDKPAKNGRATAYVCVLGTCKLPVTDPADFAKLVGEAKPY